MKSMPGLFNKLNFAGIKKATLLTLLIITIVNSIAQRSGVAIMLSTSSPDPRSGLQASIAALRVQIIKPKTDKNSYLPVVAKAVNPEDKNDQIIINKEDKKIVTPQVITAPVTRTIATIYDIPGDAATVQYTSLQARFKFIYTDMARGNVAFNPSDGIELYKLEKGINTRTFCIPPGGCTSVNIPIQITGDGYIPAAGTGAAAGKTGGYMVVIPSGYLQPGEYAFIDKTSLKPDGSALVCFAFNVKQ